MLKYEQWFFRKAGSAGRDTGQIDYLCRTLAYRPSIMKEAEYIDVSCLGAVVWKPKTRGWGLGAGG